MDQAQLALEALVGEVRVEGLELLGRQHALVDHRSRRQRGEVDTRLALGPLAGDEGEALERQAGDLTSGRGDEELLEVGHAVAGHLSDDLAVDRDLPPPEDLQALLDDDLLDPQHHRLALCRVDRQVGHAGGVVAGLRQGEVDDVPEETVGHLGEDARAVPDERVGPGGTAVVQVRQGQQRVIDDVVTGVTAHRRDHRHTAGVPLGVPPVETGVRRKRRPALVWGEGHIGHVGHRPLVNRGGQARADRTDAADAWVALSRRHRRPRCDEGYQRDVLPNEPPDLRWWDLRRWPVHVSRKSRTEPRLP